MTFESRNVYHLYATEAAETTYDCADAFIVIAKTAQEARKLASKQPGDEGAAVWTDAKLSRCSKIGYAANNSKSRIVLRDFHAG